MQPRRVVRHAGACSRNCIEFDLFDFETAVNTRFEHVIRSVDAQGNRLRHALFLDSVVDIQQSRIKWIDLANTGQCRAQKCWIATQPIHQRVQIFGNGVRKGVGTPRKLCETTKRIV